jgi:hypothetical protein
MHLPVLINCHDPDDGLGVSIAGHQHCPGTYPGGIARSAVLLVLRVGERKAGAR